MNFTLFSTLSKRFSQDFIDRHNIVSLISHRDRNSIFLVLGFASLALCIFGINALVRGDLQLGGILLFISVVCFGFIFYEKNVDHIKFIKVYISVFLILLFFYLIIIGGVENTGILWCYPLSIILFILFDAKTALIVNFSLMFIISMIFTSELQEIVTTTYSYAEKTRFIFSYFFLVLFIFIVTSAEEQLVVQLDEARNELKRAALTDELTGLGNRRFIKDALASTDRRDVHNSQLTVVMLIDIDRFKKVNDNFGHNAGDIMIRSIADNIKSIVRKTDLVARWGGEEFLVVLTNTEIEAAFRTAERLRQTIASASVSYNNHNIKTTVSIGISKFKGSIRDLEAVINIADKNLYKAKEAGRNRVVC